MPSSARWHRLRHLWLEQIKAFSGSSQYKQLSIMLRTQDGGSTAPNFVIARGGGWGVLVIMAVCDEAEQRPSSAVPSRRPRNPSALHCFPLNERVSGPLMWCRGDDTSALQTLPIHSALARATGVSGWLVVPEVCGRSLSKAGWTRGSRERH